MNMEKAFVSGRKLDYWMNSLKEHWIIWTVVSTFIAIASFWGLDPTRDVSGVLFFTLLFVSIAYFVLSSLAFASSVKAVKSFIDQHELSPNFNKVSTIEQIDGTNNYRLIAEPPQNLKIPVNTLVCIYQRGKYQRILGLGKIVQVNDDSSLELTASISLNTEKAWKALVSSSASYDVVLSILIPKDVIPDIDGYLNSENVAVTQLIRSGDIDNDGSEIEL